MYCNGHRRNNWPGRVCERSMGMEQLQMKPLLVRHASSSAAPPLSSRRGAPSHAEWSGKRISEWLTSLGLGQYAKTFELHRVSGDLLDYLTEAHLREDLGMEVLGHRLLLLRELAALKRGAAVRGRNRVLWKGAEVVHRDGPLSYLRDVFTCVPLFYEPARYVLNASSLSITESDNTTAAIFRCCPSHTRTTRGVDLSSVGAVTAVHSSKFWLCSCQADDILIEVHQDAGVQPLPPLRVLSGMGDEVAEIIRNAVEEEQMLEHVAPSSLAIGR